MVTTRSLEALRCTGNGFAMFTRVGNKRGISKQAIRAVDPIHGIMKFAQFEKCSHEFEVK